MKTLVAAALICIGICLLDFNPAGEYQYLPYTVKTGDTVSDICNTYFDCQTKNYQEFVYEVQQHNRLMGRHIHPGQKIEIPLWVRKETQNGK